MSNKTEAIALGVRAYHAGHYARWDMGDALLKFGWKPSTSGISSGGLDSVNEFRREVANAASCETETLPDPTNLVRYGVAAKAVKSRRLRDEVSVYAGYEAAVASGDESARN